MNRGPIGIDIGADRVRAVQLDRAGRAAAAVSFARSADETAGVASEASRIERVLRRRGFTGHNAVLSAPKRSVRTAMIDLPPRGSGAPAERLVRGEIARLHAMAPEAFELTWWEPEGAHDAEAQARVLAVACPHEAADPIFAAFQSVGLAVAALCPVSQALAAATADLPDAADPIAQAAQTEHDQTPPATEPKPDPVVLLDLGWSSAMVVVANLGRVLFERAIPSAGVQSLARDAGVSLGLDLDATRWAVATGRSGADSLGRVLAPLIRDHGQRLLDELDASLRFAAHIHAGLTPRQLVPVGGGAEDPDLADWLTATTGLRVVSPELPEPAPAARGSGPPLGPSMTAAVGLAKLSEHAVRKLAA